MAVPLSPLNADLAARYSTALMHRMIWKLVASEQAVPSSSGQPQWLANLNHSMMTATKDVMRSANRNKSSIGFTIAKIVVAGVFTGGFAALAVVGSKIGSFIVGAIITKFKTSSAMATIEKKKANVKEGHTLATQSNDAGFTVANRDVTEDNGLNAMAYMAREQLIGSANSFARLCDAMDKLKTGYGVGAAITSCDQAIRHLEQAYLVRHHYNHLAKLCDLTQELITVFMLKLTEWDDFCGRSRALILEIFIRENPKDWEKVMNEAAGRSELFGSSLIPWTRNHAKQWEALFPELPAIRKRVDDSKNKSTGGSTDYNTTDGNTGDRVFDLAVGTGTVGASDVGVPFAKRALMGAKLNVAQVSATAAVDAAEMIWNIAYTYWDLRKFGKLEKASSDPNWDVRESVDMPTSEKVEFLRSHATRTIEDCVKNFRHVQWAIDRLNTDPDNTPRAVATLLLTRELYLLKFKGAFKALGWFYGLVALEAIYADEALYGRGPFDRTTGKRIGEPLMARLANSCQEFLHHGHGPNECSGHCYMSMGKKYEQANPQLAAAWADHLDGMENKEEFRLMPIKPIGGLDAQKDLLG